jgi:uncharacterized protein YgfB (UPF0149 family)
MSNDFDKFCRILAIDKTLSVHPAEIHGLGCGILAAGFRPGSTNLFQQISAYIGEEFAHNESITEFFQDSLKTMESEDFEFQLCLPDDNLYTLPERAESLSAWCLGFLHGFAAVQIPLSPESSELLRDLTEISQLDAISLDNEGLGGAEEDENESHYTELTEFVRLAVVSLFMDNNKPDESEGNTLAGNNKHVRH